MTLNSSCALNTQDSFNPKAEWEAHVSKLPEPVWRLFYAVKHELDYGFIDGMDNPPPKSQLSECLSVTSDLLAQVQSSFRIYEYSIKGMDYRQAADKPVGADGV